MPDEVIDRFRLRGPAEAHIAELEQLQAIGCDQFAGYLRHANKEETLRVCGKTVMPALRDT